MRSSKNEGLARLRGTLGFSTAATFVAALVFGLTPALASAAGRANLRARVVLTNVQPLSNETTYTTVGTADYLAPIRTAPSKSASVITHMRWFTQDGQAVQTYLELESAQVGNQTWVEIRVPMRPNGHVGWVPATAIDFAGVSHSEIVVNTKTYRMQVYVRGNLVATFPVGVGQKGKPHYWPTPTGHFWLTEEFAPSGTFYGPWLFGTSDYATDTDFPDGSIVGVHGTNEPKLIPGDPSHGCIRLKNPDVLKLKRYVGIGTPLLVL